jgi:DNA-binding response OmpR family regulator
MRLLVAEDDLFALTHLQRILRSLGHEAEVVRDGLAVWKRLAIGDAGGVAILNVNLPGKGGLEITREIRSLNLSRYTYVILMASRDENCDTTGALDAGADGFLRVPVTAAALAAQLKSAERILKYEDRCHKEITRLREQMRTQPVCGSPPDHKTVPEQATVPIAPSAERAPEQVIENPSREKGLKPPVLRYSFVSESGAGSKDTISLREMQNCFSSALTRIHFVPDQSIDNVSKELPEFTVYAALVLEEQRRWLDLKLEMGRPVAAKLYRAFLSAAPPSDAELCDALEEVCNRCRDAWKAVLENTGLVPITAGWPIAKHTRDFPKQWSTARQVGSYSFMLPGSIRVTLLEQIARVSDKPLAAISLGDVLADPISSVGQKLELFKRGTVLNARYITRVRNLLSALPGESTKLRVIEPSPLALFGQRRWPRKAVDSSLAVFLPVGSAEAQLNGRVRTISESGLGAVLFGSLDLGQTVTLEFGIGGDAEFRIQAVVRSRQGLNCGFEFLSAPSQSVYDRLKEAVRALPGRR